MAALRRRADEELAGVLAHEMQHVLKRHATRALIQHVSTGLLLAALSGDVTGPLAYGAQSAQVLGQLQYSRRAEAEADAEGIKMVLAAKIDPAGTIRFFDELSRRDKQPRSVLRYLSTHPSTGDRIELRGFGVFNVRPRKTGIGRNPRTGAEVNIPPGKAVRFKPGKELQSID